jgi:hypothetical protein
MLKITGAVNVVEQGSPPRPHSPSWDVSFSRRCRAWNLIGCDGNHVLLQCDKLMSMGLGERREVLEKSGLCMFCLKHAAELECYGRGGLSKPRCTQAGCDGEHTPGMHKLMGEESIGVNLVAENESKPEENEDEDEDEEWWVGTIGAVDAWGQGEETVDEMIKSEPEEDAPFGAMQGDFGPKEEDPRYHSDNHPSSSKLMENGWWSPEPPLSYEGDEGEVQHPRQVRGSMPRMEGPGHHRATNNLEIRAIDPDESWTGQSPNARGTKRRKLKKRMERTKDQEREEARQDAWLRQMLSDMSSGEDEESCGRFAESGRWISELFKISQHSTTTSGGECSGQKMPDYS